MLSNAPQIKTFRCIAALSLLALLTGCYQEPPSTNLDTRYPTTDEELICTVAIQNTLPPLAGLQTTLSSNPRPSSISSADPVRPYYVAEDCAGLTPEGDLWGFDSPQAVLDDWRRFYPRHIQQLGTDPATTTLVGLNPDGWCEVPGSAVCTPTGSSIGVCTKIEPLTAADVALEPCPPPPPDDGPCLAITCGSGDGDCPTLPNSTRFDSSRDITFRDVPVKEVREQRLNFTHCGQPGEPDVELTVDGQIYTLSAYYDFDIPIPADPANPQVGENTCYPPDIGNDRRRTLEPGTQTNSVCSMPVVFNPQVWGGHSASTVITSNAGPDVHVRFSGNALPGALAFRAGGNEVDPEQPALVCLVREQGICSNQLAVELVNSGPGVINISSAELEPAVDGPTFVNTPVFTGDLAAGDPPQTYQIEWCLPPSFNLPVTGSLVINSDDPAIPRLELPLEFVDTQQDCSSQ